MFGSKWDWKNYTIVGHRQFKRKEKSRTVILEAICDLQIWIWHAFYWLVCRAERLKSVLGVTDYQNIATGALHGPFKYRIAGSGEKALLVQGWNLPEYLDIDLVVCGATENEGEAVKFGTGGG